MTEERGNKKDEESVTDLGVGFSLAVVDRRITAAHTSIFRLIVENGKQIEMTFGSRPDTDRALASSPADLFAGPFQEGIIQTLDQMRVLDITTQVLGLFNLLAAHILLQRFIVLPAEDGGKTASRILEVGRRCTAIGVYSLKDGCTTFGCLLQRH